MQPIVLDHVAYLVHKGQMDLALSFFAECFFYERQVREVNWDGGRAQIIASEQSEVKIQLTELDETPGIPFPLPGIHPGFRADESILPLIKQWAETHQVQLVEEPDGDKVFVSIPEVLAEEIELLPMPKIRPSDPDDWRRYSSIKNQ